jgi:NADH-quinone oxidoreductase subunit K
MDFIILEFSLLKYLILALLLFMFGVAGIFITRRNIILIIMSIELILLSINLIFIISSIYLDDITGQVFSLYVLTIAASESAIGLALVVNYYRIRSIISIDFISTIKG